MGAAISRMTKNTWEEEEEEEEQGRGMKMMMG